MNPDLNTFLQAWTGGAEVSEAERLLLLQRLESDSAFRIECAEQIRFLGILKAVQTPSPRWLQLHDALNLTAETPINATSDALSNAVMARVWKSEINRAHTHWIHWRPLTAAAAGLALGLLSASAGFAFIGARSSALTRVGVPISEPGFENPELTQRHDFAAFLGQWGGDTAHVVKSESGVRPIEGQFMLRMEPVNERPFAYIGQILDLSTVPPDSGPSDREFEVSAAFHAAEPGSLNRYKVLAYGFNASASDLGPFTLKMGEEAEVSGIKRLDDEPQTQGWQTVNLKMTLSPKIRSIAILLVARTQEGSPTKTAHYLDNVHASLLMRRPLP